MESGAGVPDCVSLHPGYIIVSLSSGNVAVPDHRKYHRCRVPDRQQPAKKRLSPNIDERPINM